MLNADIFPTRLRAKFNQTWTAKMEAIKGE
jgi:hypothetical protein